MGKQDFWKIAFDKMICTYEEKLGPSDRKLVAPERKLDASDRKLGRPE